MGNRLYSRDPLWRDGANRRVVLLASVQVRTISECNENSAEPGGLKMLDSKIT